MCGKCGKAITFLPSELCRIKRRQNAHENDRSEKAGLKVLRTRIFLNFGTLIYQYVDLVDSGAALKLLELNRSMYRTLTSPEHHSFWKTHVQNTMCVQYPSIFPLDKGPVEDEDISLLLPGTECPQHQCWLAYYRITLRKCRWIKAMNHNCKYLHLYLAQYNIAIGVSAATTIFAKNQVVLIRMKEKRELSYEQIEITLRNGQRNVVQSRILNNNTVVQEINFDQDGIMVYNLTPMENSITYYDVVKALESFPRCEWFVEAMPPRYEMPLEVYLISPSPIAQVRLVIKQWNDQLCGLTDDKTPRLDHELETVFDGSTTMRFLPERTLLAAFF